MDLQLIGNAYGAAEYAGAYISMAEPDTLRFRRVIAKAIQRCDPNLPYHSILKRVANYMLSVREVGAPEAIYILLRNLAIHSKSRVIKKVKVLRHHQRYYRVEPHDMDDLAALAEPTDPNAIRIEPIERAYMNRPTNELFDSMSFATFVEEYEEEDLLNEYADSTNTWTRIDGEGLIRRRKKSVVVQKSPWMRPNSSNPSFCFSEVCLYVAWWTVDGLPDTDEECIARVLESQKMQLDGELQKESNAKLARQHQLDLLKNARDICNVVSFAPSEYVFISNPDAGEPPAPESNDEITGGTNVSEGNEWKSRHKYYLETVVKARNFVKETLKPWMNEKKELRTIGSVFREIKEKSSSYQYPIKNSENSLNVNETMTDSQWTPFALAMDQVRKRFKSSLDGSPCKPLQMIINGDGGSGKSWLIRHIVKDLHNVFGEHASTRRTSKRVLLLAHQGTAAFNIKGITLCSALGFTSFTKSAFSVPYKSLRDTKSGPATLKRMQQQFKDVHLVIIDEFSMVSCGMIYWIDRRMREIWSHHSDVLFGGRDVYFTGDAVQLDPVAPSSLSTPLAQISNDVQRRGREIWTATRTVCMLTSQNRGKTDPERFDALRHLRQKVPTQADIDLFNSRCLPSTSEPSWTSIAKHIAYKNVDVAAANERSIFASEKSVLSIMAQHFVQQKRLTTKRDIPVGTVQALVKDAKIANTNRDRVVAIKVQLCVGAPVTITFNMAQTAGLCNDTNAVVYDFIFVAGSDLPIVLIQIIDPYLGPSLLDDVPNIVPIVPKEVSWGKESSDIRVVRRGIPLRLAYAMTVHKVQGLTCIYVVFHSSSFPSIASVYVALSRIQHRNSIILTHKLTLEKLSTTPAKIAIFQREEKRLLENVARTTEEAQPIIHLMKRIALDHNRAIIAATSS